MNLSLIIPCYNEAANLPKLVEQCRQLVERGNIEVILVDNGSTDSTPSILPDLVRGQRHLRILRVEVNRGYGDGILNGLRAANGDVLGWTHADLQTSPMDVVDGFARFTRAAGPTKLFVKGAREGRPLADVIFTAGMSLFETLLSGRGMRDINAQPTMFHREFFATWENPPSDFSLDLYAYWKAKRESLTIARLPVRFPPRLHGTSSWNVGLASKWKFIKRTIGYSWKLRMSIGN